MNNTLRSNPGNTKQKEISASFGYSHKIIKENIYYTLDIKKKNFDSAKRKTKKKILKPVHRIK